MTVSTGPQGQEKVIPTMCASHCGGSCLLKVHVRDGVITRIETDDGPEPQVRGCWKGRSYRQRVYAPDRVLHPLKRVGARGEGKFEEISWDEALTAVAGEIKRVRDTYGPASIIFVPMGGDLGVIHGAHLFDRLLCLAGGHTRTWGVTSFGQGMFSSLATYGTLHCSNSRDDLMNTRFVLMWGFDPGKCINGPNTAWYLAQVKEKGVRIVSIDPRQGDTAAAVAAQWVTIRPSTDAAMAIAMAYVIVSEGLQDQAFIDRYTVGFDKYKDYLLGREDGVPKTPAWAEDITGVPAETIAALAREYATTKPAALLAGIGPGRTASGEMFHRAAAVLAAITGNVGVHGGDAAARAWESLIGGLPYKVLPVVTRIMPSTSNPVERGFPVVQSTLPTYRGPRVHYSKVADAILRGKAGGYFTDYKMLMTVNCNYLNAMPNSNKVIEALKKVESLIVVEQFMTTTAKYADIVLPTNTYMERRDYTPGASTWFHGIQNKIIEPLGESKSHFDIAIALAEKLGIEGYTDKTEDEWMQQVATMAGVADYDKLRRDGILWIERSEPYVAFRDFIEDPENHQLSTPSGKIEIYSQTMAAWNNPKLPPVPQWVEPYETLADPLAKKYPLQLITPHGKRRALGQFQTLPWLQELMPEMAWVSIADARARGIRDGDMVKVFNDRGVIMLPVKVTRRLMPGVVQVESGAWHSFDENGVDRGGNANTLLGDDLSIGGHFPYNTCLVEVQKAEEE